MSELKVASLFEFEKVLKGKSNKLFYSKSNADKVIAEKDKEIAELKEQIEVLKHQACKMDCMTVKLYNEACDDIIHQKYKRCLAMADFCESQCDYYNTLGNGFWLVRGDVKKRDEYRKKSSDFWWKWHKRWLELAERFKEAK